MPARKGSARVLQLPVDPEEFARSLLDWYGEHQRDLPWRRQTDPYRIWLSEVMLQQTRVAAAQPYYQRFLECFPTVQSLARARESEVLAEWAGLGYYSRARNLHRAAQIICRRHDGRFPSDYREALQLPGVGRYTAGAVLSIAYGQALPVLDGNVGRLLVRYLAAPEPVRSLTTALWRLLEELVREPFVSRRIGAFNQALMELGALVCTPRNPRCGACPLEKSCGACRAGIQAQLPQADRSQRVVHLHFLAALVPRESLFLLRRNEEGPFLKGFWETPNIEGRSSSGFAEQAHRRWGVELTVMRELPPLRHRITHHQLHFAPLLCELRAEFVPQGWKWADLSCRELAFPAYVRKLGNLAKGKY